MHRVFVYGTLLSGEGNNYLLRGSELLGPATVLGLEMHDLGSFPACIPTERDSDVIGEVWEVNDKAFQSLDYLEGYPEFYNRIEVPTTFGLAWVYICDRASKNPLIPGGNWKEYIGTRRERRWSE